MKKIAVLFLSLLFVFLGFSTAPAATVGLFDWAFNVDGIISEDSAGDSMPTSGSLDSEGLGTLTWSTNEAGSHSFIAFFDHEIDELTNTFFNEYGEAVNSPETGSWVQSWEIDDPWNGDIYSNVLSGTLDTTNSAPYPPKDYDGDDIIDDYDVSWAMGWDFTLDPGEKADIRLLLSRTQPGEFYMVQGDPESGEAIYFSSDYTVRGAEVPEPATMILLGTGLAGLLGIRRKKFRK